MTVLLTATALAAKLVIVIPDQPSNMIEYASMQRCQRAAQTMKDKQQAAVEKWIADTQVTVGAPFHWLDPKNPSLGIMPAYPRPTVAQVYCVPA